MESTRFHRTVCPRNCYCTCGMPVGVRDGRIVSIEGDPLNPATRGKVCLKGISYARRISAADHLMSPLRRRGEQNEHESVRWEEALNEIAERLERLRSTLGPRSVLYYEGFGSHDALSILADAFWNPFGGPALPAPTPDMQDAGPNSLAIRQPGLDQGGRAPVPARHPP